LTGFEWITLVLTKHGVESLFCIFCSWEKLCSLKNYKDGKDANNRREKNIKSMLLEVLKDPTKDLLAENQLNAAA
jgi:hypothetical protein